MQPTPEMNRWIANFTDGKFAPAKSASEGTRQADADGAVKGQVSDFVAAEDPAASGGMPGGAGGKAGHRPAGRVADDHVLAARAEATKAAQALATALLAAATSTYGHAVTASASQAKRVIQKAADAEKKFNESLEVAVEIALILVAPTISVTAELCASWVKRSVIDLRALSEKQLKMFFDKDQVVDGLKSFSKATVKHTVSYKVDTNKPTEIVDDYAEYLIKQADQIQADLQGPIQSSNLEELAPLIARLTGAGPDKYEVKLKRQFDDYCHQLLPAIRDMEGAGDSVFSDQHRYDIYEVLNAPSKGQRYAEIREMTAPQKTAQHRRYIVIQWFTESMHSLVAPLAKKKIDYKFLKDWEQLNVTGKDTESEFGKY